MKQLCDIEDQTIINLQHCLIADPLQEYSELFKRKISVDVEPLAVSMINPNSSASVDHVDCHFSIHRDTCISEPIGVNDTIDWDTRICFRWSCTNTSMMIQHTISRILM